MLVYNKQYTSLIEEFNVSPQYQNAVQNGPDIGMTSGNPDETFPSHSETLGGSLLPNGIQIKLSMKDVKKLYKLIASASQGKTSQVSSE
jgi:hypothetical protein